MIIILSDFILQMKKLGLRSYMVFQDNFRVIIQLMTGHESHFLLT